MGTRRDALPLAARTLVGALARELGRCSGSLALALVGVCAAPALAWATTYVVNTTGDPGPNGTQSLRQAIVSANGSAGNTIAFDASLDGATITLTGGYVLISKSMLLSGPGASRLTISGNDASRIFLVETQGGPVTFSGLTLAHGYTAGGLAGAAIGAFYSPVTVQDSVISANSCANQGGGIFATGADLTITRSRIIGNHAGYDGGGVVARCNGGCGNLTISESTISGNTAGEFGAGIKAYRLQSVSISGSTISANRILGPIAQRGAALFIYATVTTPVIDTSTIAANYSFGSGGGVYADTASFHFVTIAGNSTHAADSNGLEVRPGGAVTLQDSILANNFSSASTVDVTGSITANYTLIRNAGSATVGGTSKLIGLDPQLGTLGDHGGSTWTMVPAAGSPAVDGGEAGLPPSLDQRGLPRPVGVKADMGAVERQSVEDFIFRDRFEGS